MTDRTSAIGMCRYVRFNRQQLVNRYIDRGNGASQDFIPFYTSRHISVDTSMHTEMVAMANIPFATKLAIVNNRARKSRSKNLRTLLSMAHIDAPDLFDLNLDSLAIREGLSINPMITHDAYVEILSRRPDFTFHPLVEHIEGREGMCGYEENRIVRRGYDKFYHRMLAHYNGDDNLMNLYAMFSYDDTATLKSKLKSHGMSNSNFANAHICNPNASPEWVRGEMTRSRTGWHASVDFHTMCNTLCYSEYMKLPRLYQDKYMPTTAPYEWWANRVKPRSANHIKVRMMITNNIPFARIVEMYRCNTNAGYDAMRSSYPMLMREYNQFYDICVQRLVRTIAISWHGFIANPGSYDYHLTMASMVYESGFD